MLGPLDSRADEALVATYKGFRDPAAIDLLLRRHWAEAFRLALRALGDPAGAEDAAQQAFVSVVRGAGRFEPGRPFLPWFRTLVMNAVRMQARALGRRRRREERFAAARPAAASPAGEKRLVAAELEEHLRRLPVDLRLALILNFYEGRPHEEVATVLRCPLGTAKSRIRRGLERLRESMGAGALGAVSMDSIEASLRTAAKAPPPEISPAPAADALVAKARSLALRALVAKAGAAIAVSVLAVAVFLGSGALPAKPKNQGGGRAPELAAAPAERDGADATREPLPAPGPAGAGARVASNPESPPAPMPEPRDPGRRPPAAAREPAPAPPAAPASLVEGRVVSTRDGTPVSGVEVFLSLVAVTQNATAPRGSGLLYLSGEERATTAEDGIFHIATSGNHALRADGAILRREDGLPCAHVAIVLHREGMEPLAQPLSAKEVEAHQPLTLQMREGGRTLAARVVNRDTRVSLAGVKLAVYQGYQLAEVSAHWSTYLASGAGGEVRVGGLAAGAVRVTVTDERFAATSTHFALGEGALTVVEVAAEPAAQVVVEVVDARGQAVPFASARLIDARGATPGRLKGGKDLDPMSGRMTFENVPPGDDYQVVAGRGSVGGRREGDRFVWVGDATSEPFSLGLGDSRRVRIVLPEAPPGADPRVPPYRPPPSLPPAYAPPPPAPAPEHPATLALRVRPPEGWSAERLAIALGVGLRLDAPGGEWRSRQRARVEPDSEGRVLVAFDGCPAGARGTVALRLQGTGGAMIEEIFAGDPAREVALDSTAGASLSGRILDASGAPAAAATVRVAVGDEERFSLWGAETDAEGRFVMSDVPRRPLVLRVWKGRESRRIRIDTREESNLGELRLATE